MYIKQPVTYLFNWMTNKAVLFYFIAFSLCSLIWNQYAMEFRLAFISIISVLLFFFGSEYVMRKYQYRSPKRFVKSIFWAGFLIRVVWAVYIYYFNLDVYGQALGNGADTEWYVPVAQAGVEALKDGNWNIVDLWRTKWMAAYDDMGYPFWLMIVYLVTDNVSDVFVPFMVKCLVGAFCPVFIYNIGQRHWGEAVGRIAAVFVMLNPNMIYWCGDMMKEAEMVFLVCLFVDKTDKALHGKNWTFMGLLPASLTGLSLFLFRVSLGIVAFLAVMAEVVFASSRVMTTGKKIIAGFMVATVLLIGMGENIRTRTRDIVETVQSDQQKSNMEWRTRRKGGNSFARYAGAAVFAPLIFTIPFPSFNNALQTQVSQRMLSGGSYIKNILSFFVLLMLVIMLFSKEWRQHVFIIAITCGYLAALTLSAYAQSGRFHMPIMPFLMLFASYGVCVAYKTMKYRRWYNIALWIELIACIAWNWFKLRGRGMA